ncbi:DUF5793 family protein [Halorientalis regularis]|jgi:hypothetical protein|uniref:Uncharacterized protein n=1 Tax=Halorientalis regularis TaxID=660518 RepID=A0A1G7FT23_9EURY|nr:DUF5793 family protein [Halorientalis regularis]SDE79057.1 hypothetical protein SAMN05216218_101337 [Halorientalis regularis]
MRRDYFTLELHDVADDPVEQPVVHIEYDGPSDELETRLTPGTDLDLAFRFQTPVDDPDADGVLAITERLTGDFVLEVNADADDILDLVDAAKAYGQEESDAPGCYSLEIDVAGGDRYTTDKRTLLVYDDEGDLRRNHSLIPSGVEL